MEEKYTLMTFQTCFNTKTGQFLTFLNIAFSKKKYYYLGNCVGSIESISILT